MNKKVREKMIAIGTMVVLSFGIIVGIRAVNGSSKSEGIALDTSAYTNENASVIEAFALGESENAITGYAVTASSIGFNAETPITLKITFDADKTTITNFEVVSQAETTGLGANVESDEFKAMFVNTTAPVYTADMTAKGTNFDQITGATVSSKAVAYAVNAASDFLATME